MATEGLCRRPGCNAPRATGNYGFCSAACRSRRRSQQHRDESVQEGTFVASSNDDQTEGYPLELSCTYTKSGANVPIDQYHGFCRFLTTTHMGTAALETGEKEAFEHIQAFFVVTARGHKNTAITALLRRIKQATGTLGQPGYKMQLKPFGASQTVSMMIGYCFKARKHPTFRAFNWNVTESMVRQGILDYDSTCSSYTRGKSILHKTTVFRQLMAFISARLPDLRPVPDLAQAARWAMQLGSHTFSEEFIRYGNQMMQSKACALQRIVTSPQDSTIDDVRAILFYDDLKSNSRTAPAYANIDVSADSIDQPMILAEGYEQELNHIVDPRCSRPHADYDTMSYERALELNHGCRADTEAQADGAETFAENTAPDPLAGPGALPANVQFANDSTYEPNLARAVAPDADNELDPEGTTMNLSLYWITDAPRRLASAALTTPTRNACREPAGTQDTASSSGSDSDCTRDGRTRCSLCGKRGHNKRTCPKRTTRGNTCSEEQVGGASTQSQRNNSMRKSRIADSESDSDYSDSAGSGTCALTIRRSNRLARRIDSESDCDSEV